jgi:hypothetical protein
MPEPELYMTVCYTSVGSRKKEMARNPNSVIRVSEGKCLSLFLSSDKHSPVLNYRNRENTFEMPDKEKEIWKAYIQNTKTDWHPLHLHDGLKVIYLFYRMGEKSPYTDKYATRI